MLYRILTTLSAIIFLLLPTPVTSACVDYSTPPSSVSSITVPNRSDFPGAHGLAASDVVLAYQNVSESGGLSPFLEIYDISDPLNPVHEHVALLSAGEPGGTLIDGTTLYTTTKSDGLEIRDVSTPSVPVLLGALDLPGHAWSGPIVREGNRLYLGDSFRTVDIVDISNLAAPALLGTTPDLTTGQVLGIAVQGIFLYACVDFAVPRLAMVDVSDPVNPSVVGSMLLPEFGYALAADGPVLYFGGHNGGLLRVIDVSNPLALHEMTTVPADEDVLSVRLDGDVLYFSDRGGFAAVNVTLPASPTLIGRADVLGGTGVHSLTVNSIHVWANRSGVEVLSYPTQCASTAALEPEWPDNGWVLYPPAPNPTRRQATIRFSVPSREFVRLHIVDVAGRRVRELARGVVPSGTNRVTWDGRNEGGRLASPGVYFLRLAGDGVSETRRIVLAGN